MDKYIATISGVIGSLISYAVNGLGMAVTVLIVMMAIDYATGIMSAIVNRSLNSRIGFTGIVRKLYYLLLVGAIYSLSLVVEGIGYAGDGVAIALCVLELISIAENGNSIGAPMPQFVKNLLLVVKNKTDNKEGDE